MEYEHFWWCVWVTIFAIIYCAALAWPITTIIIFDIEQKIKKMFKKE